MNKRIIFVDLDDTLIDTSYRHYKVYSDIVSDLNLKKDINKKEFWKLKRNCQSTLDILNEKDKSISKVFYEEWIKKIEQKKYLRYDELFDKSLMLLKELKNENLILLTMRNNRFNLMWELNKLGIKNYFETILSCSPLKNEDKTIPVKEYLKKREIVLDKKSLIIGDSETDINTGKQLKIITVAVNYGIRSKKNLISLKPDFCLNNIDEISKIVSNLNKECI